MTEEILTGRKAPPEVVLAASIIALLAPSTRQTTPIVEEEPALDLAA